MNEVLMVRPDLFNVDGKEWHLVIRLCLGRRTEDRACLDSIDSDVLAHLASVCVTMNDHFVNPCVGFARWGDVGCSHY
jgi:hypothetical protein